MKVQAELVSFRVSLLPATSHSLSSVLECAHVATFPLLPKNKQTKNTYQIRFESILKALFL